jgi:two-component system, OmpR family, phosphate regulon sensor histidine kinase PhoR
MIDTPIKSYFHLGFRLALIVTGAAFAFFWLILSLHLYWREAFQYALIAAVGVHFTSYFSIRFYLNRRFERISQLLDNISSKNFEEQIDTAPVNRDELDVLIEKGQRTMANVEREIQRLNRLENYRKEFIGDISHELKTPIFAIQGFLETLLDGAMYDEKVNRSFMQKAMKNVNRLTILTKDLLEISRLETGELRIDLQKIHLRSAVIEVTESLMLKAEQEQIRIEVASIENGIHVYADRNQLKQVLVNLIENAVKYNKPGGVVDVGIRAHPKTREKILVYVKDSGIGIEAYDLARVTERFYRIDKSRSREKGGTGLGLSIVKHIIEAHHEQLFIQSKPDVGSEFSFSLQLVYNPG